jgi:hypothetical protein
MVGTQCRSPGVRRALDDGVRVSASREGRRPRSGSRQGRVGRARSVPPDSRLAIALASDCDRPCRAGRRARSGPLRERVSASRGRSLLPRSSTAVRMVRPLAVLPLLVQSASDHRVIADACIPARRSSDAWPGGRPPTVSLTGLPESEARGGWVAGTLLRALVGLGVGLLGGDLAALRAAQRVRQRRPQATGFTTPTQLEGRRQSRRGLARISARSSARSRAGRYQLSATCIGRGR